MTPILISLSGNGVVWRLLLAVGVSLTYAGSGLHSQSAEAASILRFSNSQIRQLPLWNISIASVRIGDLQRDTTALDRTGNALRLSDGSIVVANSQSELRFFDSSGRPIRTVGRRGQGPGEFGQLSSVFRLDGDSILTFDAQGPRHRLSVFTKSGRYVRSTVLNARVAPWAGVAVDSRGALTYAEYVNRVVLAAVRAGRPGVASDSSPLIRVSTSGIVDTLMQLAGVARAIRGPDRVTDVRPVSHGLFASNSTGIVASRSMAFELRLFDAVGRHRKTVVVDEQPRRMTAELRKRLQTSTGGADSRAREGTRTTPTFDDQLPAISRLVVDRDGRVWVRRWTFDDETEAEWVVFSKDGNPVARTRVPSKLSVLDADLDWLLAKFTNDDGIESIRVYPLPRP